MHNRHQDMTQLNRFMIHRLVKNSDAEGTLQDTKHNNSGNPWSAIEKATDDSVE